MLKHVVGVGPGEQSGLIVVVSADGQELDAGDGARAAGAAGGVVVEGDAGEQAFAVAVWCMTGQSNTRLPRL